MLLKIYKRDNSINLIIDGSVSFTILFVIEIIIIFGLKLIRCETIGWLPYFVLGTTDFIIYLLRENITLDEFFSKYYRNNRQAIILITISLVLLYCIVVNLYNQQNQFFKEHLFEISIITAGYIAVNIFYFISIFKNIQKYRKIQELTEYQAYLNHLAMALHSREHEYKNEINVILGIAEQKQGNLSLEKIIKYGEEIYDQKSQNNTNAVISNNCIVAALILRMDKAAKQKNIEFAYFEENPFPMYPINEYEFIEMLSNLLNNAFEAVAELPRHERFVSVQFLGNQIEVVNTIDRSIQNANAFKFGNNRYSTKGIGRGYGLRNVFKILRKNNIHSEIYVKEGKLYFTLIFDIFNWISDYLLLF